MAYIVFVEIVSYADGHRVEVSLDGEPYGEPIGPFETFGEAHLAAEELRLALLQTRNAKDLGKLN